MTNTAKNKNEIISVIYRGLKPFLNEREGTILRMVPLYFSVSRFAELQEKYPGDFIELSFVENGGVYVGGDAAVGGPDDFDLLIAPELSDSPNILIMRDEGAGDLLLSLPAVHALRMRYPDAVITYATKPAYFDIIKLNRDIDSVTSVHEVELNHNCGWDLVVNWCRAIENYNMPRNRKHRIDSFAAHIGVDLSGRDIPITIPAQCRREAFDLLGDKPLDVTTVAIVLSAASWNRTWPDYKVPALMDLIREKLKGKCRFVLSDNDELAGEVVESAGGVGPDIINLAGKTKSFMSAAAIIDQYADVVITPDTGLAHVAGALRKKTIVLMGTIPAEVRYSTYKNVHVVTAADCGNEIKCSPCWDYQSRGPGVNRFCKDSKDVTCINGITAEVIADKFDKIVNGIKYDKKLYSLIVPFHVANFDHCEQNSEWLAGILKNNEGAEIIIVDNGSCSEWKAYLESEYSKRDVKIMGFNESLSYSAACNVGAKASKCDAICFINSDVRMNAPEWYVPFTNRLNAKTAIVGAAGRRLLSTWLGGTLHYDNSVHYVEGWCVWMTRDTFNSLNGWDESFVPFYGEDADLSMRVIYSLRKKIEIVPVEQCQIRHIGGQSIKTEYADNEREILTNNCLKLREKWQHVFNPESGWRDDQSVAILIPAHVKEEYLIECLNSVKEISHRDAHVYVGLDCMEFDKKADYPNFTFYDLNFREVNHVRNYLVANSIEPFIYFLDADNYIYPGAIEKFKHEIIKHNADVVYSQAEILDQCEIKWFNNSTNGLLNTYQFGSRLLKEKNYIDMGSIIRRSALPSGNPFDVTLKALHDWDLWLVMDAAGKKFHYIEEPLFVYRVHENNLSRSADHWSESIGLMRKKHGVRLGYKNELPRISLVTIAKTQREIDEKIKELSAQTIVPDEYCYSITPDLCTAWEEAFAKVTGDIVIVNETDAHPIDNNFIEDLLKSYEPNKVTKGLEINCFWENYANIIFDAKLLKRFPVTKDAGLAQDTRWYCELKKNGIKIEQAKIAPVIHHHPSVTEKKLERAYEYGREHVKLIQEYNYYPLDKLKRRHELEVAIGTESLRGINDELRQSNTD